VGYIEEARGTEESRASSEAKAWEPDSGMDVEKPSKSRSRSSGTGLGERVLTIPQ
jgi:hypothetical protein